MWKERLKAEAPGLDGMLQSIADKSDADIENKQLLGGVVIMAYALGVVGSNAKDIGTKMLNTMLAMILKEHTDEILAEYFRGEEKAFAE